MTKKLLLLILVSFTLQAQTNRVRHLAADTTSFGKTSPDVILYRESGRKLHIKSHVVADSLVKSDSLYSRTMSLNQGFTYDATSQYFHTTTKGGAYVNPGRSRSVGTFYVSDTTEAAIPHGLFVVHRMGPVSYDSTDDISASMIFIELDGSKTTQPGDVGGIRTFVNTGQISGSYSPAKASGIKGNVYHKAKATLPLAEGGRFQSEILGGDSTTVITSARGATFKAAAKTNGTITNAFGAYFEDQTAGGTENASIRFDTTGRISWNNDASLRRTAPRKLSLTANLSADSTLKADSIYARAYGNLPLSGYLPLTGGTMTGTVFADLGRMGGRVVTGHTAAQSSVDGDGLVQINSSFLPLNMFGYSSTASIAPAIGFARAHSNSWGTNTIVVNGDRIGRISFVGSNGNGATDGTQWTKSSDIIATIDGTPGASGDMPGKLSFRTSPDGSGVPGDVLTLDAAKLAIFAGAVTIVGTTTLATSLSGSLTATSGVVSAFRQGTDVFVTIATRKAVYLPGVTTSSKFLVGPVATADLVLPVAGDLCSAITKTDSLIVLRFAGTTSGLEFAYQQVK